jgi:hypothetical protein
LLPVSPVGLRFDLRHVLSRSIRIRVACNLVVGTMTRLRLPFHILEKLFVRLESQWS